MMRACSTLCVLLFAMVCTAAPPTYDEAVKLSGNIDSARAKKWIENVLQPFADHHFESAIQQCIQALREGSMAARLVADFRAAGGGVSVSDDAPSPFSTCIKDKLQALHWPRAPREIRYLPIEVSAGKSDREPRNADDVIMSITPTEKPMDHTRTK